MKSQAITFPSGSTVDYHFEASLEDLYRLAPPQEAIIITDETVAGLYGEKFKEYRRLTFPAGEEHKASETIANLTKQLLAIDAHRGTMLIGLGGGVVTDVVGYLASCFMRGVPVAFVPTTFLGQVDAAIGGKNGVNIGLHKNMIGTIWQPLFVLFDTTFLNTLADEQWSNGFAEVIKYGHIADARILTTLNGTDMQHFQKNAESLNNLIEGCVDVKNKIVHADERENGLRRVLNFGHTAGHAFETLYNLPHGHAVGLGMRVAVRLSEIHTGLTPDTGEQLNALLQAYGLPLTIAHDADAVMQLILSDKKRVAEGVRYVLLEKLGVAVTKVLDEAAIRDALAVVAA